MSEYTRADEIRRYITGDMFPALPEPYVKWIDETLLPLAEQAQDSAYQKMWDQMVLIPAEILEGTMPPFRRKGDSIRLGTIYADLRLNNLLDPGEVDDEEVDDEMDEEVQDDEPEPARPSSKPRLIFNAGEFRDLDRELRKDRPYPMRLDDGTEIEVVAGDPSSGQLGVEHADLDEIRISGTSL